MRYLIASLLLVLSGCLAVQEPHNPMTPAEGVAPVESASTAPVESTPAAAPAMDKLDLMKSMFLAQKDLNQQLLRMSSQLTTEELAELNEWLQQYGVQIQRKKVEAPAPSPRESRVY